MNDDAADADSLDAALGAFAARHVPARLAHVPGILPRRLWQLNRPGLWARLETRAANRTTDPNAHAMRCITFLHREYGAEGLPGSLDVSMDQLCVEETVRTIFLNGHAQLGQDIVRWKRHHSPSSEGEDGDWLERLLTETDGGDAGARLGVITSIRFWTRQRVTGFVSPATMDNQPARILAHVIAYLFPKPSTYSAYHDVLTNPVLLQCIGAFQFDIHTWIAEVESLYHVPEATSINDVVGLLPRLAIIQSDEFALRRLYQLAILPENSSIPKFSFVNAMHDAATEGHLAMLQWLHTLRPRLSCRPDTMAMTVRSGWAEVVEWLCEHARDSSSLSMSNAPVCDAARWGFLDVLRILHKYGEDAWFSPNVMDIAAASGQLAIVQWLHANRPEGCTKAALSDALLEGHYYVVVWLADHCEVDVDHQILSDAIASGDHRRVSSALAFWKRRRGDPVIQRAVQSGFERACAIHSDNVDAIGPIVVTLRPGSSGPRTHEGPAS